MMKRYRGLHGIALLVAAGLLLTEAPAAFAHPTDGRVGAWATVEARSTQAEVRIRVKGQRLGRAAKVTLRGVKGQAMGDRIRQKIRRAATMKGLKLGVYRVTGKRIKRGPRVTRAVAIDPERLQVTAQSRGSVALKYRKRPARDQDELPVTTPSPQPPPPRGGEGSEQSEIEAEVLRLTNRARAKGRRCGSHGYFEATQSLERHRALAAAAGRHSRDMAENGFFDHMNPKGQGPAERATAAGYSWSFIGENIAYGYSSPSAVVASWLASPGHCANMMRPEYLHLGVGHFEGKRSYWTQVFGAPR